VPPAGANRVGVEVAAVPRHHPGHRHLAGRGWDAGDATDRIIATLETELPV
jgi:hypothetical protein